MASVPEGKEGLVQYCDFLIQRIQKLGVSVRTSSPFTPELVKKNGFEKVIVAVGSEPCNPESFGFSSKKTVSAEDVLNGLKLREKNVVVVGGGLVGVETALFLKRAGKQVSIVEIASDVLNNMGVVLKRNMLSEMGANSIGIYVDSKIIKTEDESVTIENVVGEIELPADHVVIAVGYQSKTGEWEHLDPSISSILIGDAFRVGMLLDISLQIQEFLFDSTFLGNGKEILQDKEQACTLI